jgi:CubicO group peptidase (beta-lactamase class C family)
MRKQIQRLIFSCVLGATIAPECAFADEPALDGLAESVREARLEWKAPGIAAAVVHNDRVVFMGGFGERSLTTGGPVDPHTRFALGSLTKAFLATAMGMLVDEGRLAWDDPVIKYLPEFRVRDPYVTREVTLRDLLAHRTGIEPTDFLWLRGFDAQTSIRHLQYAGQATTFRATWAYNNMMYVVAAEIIKRVSGLRFEDFVSTRIFSPLGMTETTFASAAEPKTDNASGTHVIADGNVREVEPFVSQSVLGAAGIVSTAADMTKWLRFLLNQGTVGNKALVKPQTLAECFTPQVVVSASPYPVVALTHPSFYTYGFGWFLQDYKGHVLAMHTGSLFGTDTLVALVPDLRLGLVILINAAPVEYRHAFMYEVVDRFLGIGDSHWNRDTLKLYSNLQERAASRRATEVRERPSNTHPSLSLDSYVGSYSNPLAGQNEIVRLANGGLSLQTKPLGSYSLSHWSFDTFEASDDRVPTQRFLLTFEIGPEGRVVAYSGSGGGRFVRESRSATNGSPSSASEGRE